MDIFKLKDKKLTAENILKVVSEYDIYSLYLGNFVIGSKMHSPFRKDNVKSFGVFEAHSSKDLLFNDYRLGAGNVFKFVMTMEGVSYLEALSIINQQFNLGLYDTINVDYKKREFTKYAVKKADKEQKSIHIKIRDYSKRDVEYFSPLDVTKIHKLYPISHVWINGFMFNTESLAYAFRYDRNVYKIYQPFSIDYKWITNISPEIGWYGLDLLPEEGDLLFVASSNKDAAVFHQLDYNAIAPHTEAQKFTLEMYEELSKRFKRIIIFYDNDETGILKAKEFSEYYKLEYLHLEEESTKDPFEFIKKYNSMEDFDKWIKQWI